MKRYFYYVVAGILALCAASCTTNELDGKIEGNNTLPNELPNELYVTIDNGEGDTRIQLNEECKTVWTEDDVVSVFYRSDANNKFLFMGDTGDRSGALVVEENRMADATAQIDKVVLLYPYSDNYKLNATTKSVAVQIPGTQYYENGSYGVGANLMASVGTSNDFALKSVCGWIEIKLTGAASVTSVTLTGNDKEQLAGDATLYYEDLRLALLGEDGGPDDSSQVGGSLFFGEYVRTITLDCGEGVALDSTTPTSFYFVLAPQTFDEGITIKATLSDGTTITKSTTKSLTISRNTIRPMAAFDVQPTDEIWYTSTDGNIVEPYDATVFGANIVSNTYENGKGVIKFDGDVTKIGGKAFCDKTSLASISIPASVTVVGGSSFNGCTSLAKFEGKYASDGGKCLIVDGVLQAFALGCGITNYTIPNSVTEIGHRAFYGCSGLENITIPDSVTKISTYAFWQCTSLISITIPDSVTSIIGMKAFYNCSSLKNVTIGNNITGIGESAFRGCTSLTSVTIGKKVTSIGYDAFYGCTSLASVHITDIAAWCGITFGGPTANPLYYAHNLYLNGELVTDLVIPDSVTSIGEGAFAGCSSLASVTIPDSVTEIGDFAFYYSSSLASVYCKATTPPSLGGSVFYDNASELKIYVPTESVEAYQTAPNWSDHAEYIEPYNFE